MRLLLLQTCTNPAMSTNELERHHIRSLLIPERLNLFKCLEFPAVASDAPVAIFAMHDLPHELCYSQLQPGQVKSRTNCPKRVLEAICNLMKSCSMGLAAIDVVSRKVVVIR
jgi:hypothetical protein